MMDAMQFRIPREDRAYLEEIADRKKWTTSQLLREIVMTFIAQDINRRYTPRVKTTELSNVA